MITESITNERVEQLQRRLSLVRWVALADFLLLALLLTASFTGARGWVSLLGPLHGGNFLLLLTLVGLGAVDGLWRWWFPALVLVTGGPLGAWLGEWIIGRRLQGTAK
jgi:hypothetical protein